MKYRYTVIHEGITEADSENEAAERALSLSEGGFAMTTAVQVEAIREGDHE